MKSEAEKEAEKRLNDFAAAAGANPGADRAALAMAALEEAQNADRVAAKKKHWAYLVSLGLPPFGLLFAVWYVLSGKQDGLRVAIVCVILTGLSLLVAWLALRLIAGTMPTEAILGPNGQVQGLSPEELKQLFQ